jgi:hypothetical protein
MKHLFWEVRAEMCFIIRIILSSYYTLIHCIENRYIKLGFRKF